MIDRNQLDAYLTRATQGVGGGEAHAILTRFMCRCLLLGPQRFLPEVGENALAVAKAFWLEGRGQAEELLNARVGCWAYLDNKGRSVEIQDQEDAAMRAVICVLYAEPDSDDASWGAVEWFAEMLDRLGDYSAETAQLMRT